MPLFNKAGGHSSFHQSVANEATDDWRGYEPGTPGSRTCFPFSTVDKLSTLAFFGFMVLHDTSPKPTLPQQLRRRFDCLAAILNNVEQYFSADFATLPFPRLPSHRSN